MTENTALTPSITPKQKNTRRFYSKTFKANLVQQCLDPNTSIAKVARAHDINANLVHRWIRQGSFTHQVPEKFIPVPVQNQQSTVYIELSIQSRIGKIDLKWPDHQTDQLIHCLSALIS